MKTPEEMLTRGKGNFINCTDYDDAIEAMQEYAEEYHKAQANDSNKSEKPSINNDVLLENEAKRSELLFAFIKEIKDEFKDENWDYLDFIAERILSK